MRAAEPFLAAAAARPDDDLPRLIYADWLDEQGHAARAEFIRLQCAAARGEPTTSQRAAELETTHRDAWLAELPVTVYHAEFRRGFVEHIVLTARAFLRDGDLLRRSTPVRSIALLGAAPVLGDLLARRLLNGLKGLHLTDSPLGDEGAVRLADAACLRNLTTLRLGQTGLSDPGAAALARSRHLGRLQTLVLRGNAIGDFGAWELARSATLAGLTALDVAANEIGQSGASALQSTFVRVDVSGQREMSRWWRPARQAAKTGPAVLQ